MSRHGSLRVYPTWNLLSFSDVQTNFLKNQIVRFSAMISLQIFLCPVFSLLFCDCHYAYVNKFDSIPQISEALFIDLHSFFLFSLLLKLDALNLPVFQLANSFFCQLTSAFEFLTEFFILIIVLHFSTPAFLFGSFYKFPLLISLFGNTSSHTFL